MKINTFINLLITFILTFNVYSQGNDYFVPNHFPEITNSNNYSATTDYDFLNSEPKVFNVHFYYLDLTTGGGYQSGFFNEDYALDRIAKLNIAFNPYNIFFKYRGYQVYSEIYNGSELTDQPHQNIIERMSEVVQTDGTDNNINIVLNHTTCQPDYGSASIYKKIISLRYCHAERVRVNFQMGHLLGLLKTHQGTNGNINGIPLNSSSCSDNQDPNFTELKIPSFSSTGYTPENATRVTTSSDYNADVAGDMVTDTPACFLLSDYNYCHFDDPAEDTFEYINDDRITDNSSEHLMYENIDLLNFMSYLHKDDYNMRHFTNGQGVRMRETIAMPALQFNDVSTSIASLYEPYVGEYFLSGPNNSNYRPLFQAGFDYKFISCSGNYNIPSNYDDTSFDYETRIILNSVDKDSVDFNNITHPNHSAIFIKQLNVDNLDNGGIPRKCYNNTNRTASNGTIIKFNDNVINTNISVYPKGQTEINGQNLIQNLDQGLYLIQKNYDDGTQEQNTIYKNEN